MSTMKAVRIHSYGGSEVLTYEDAPRPVPGAGDVLIRVHATTVNPFDCATRAGYMAGFVKNTFPFILGTDVSGEIEAVGPGVTGFSKGDEVFTRVGVARDGAYAEYALAQAADVTAKPRSLDHLHAAALPHVTLTAWQALYVLADLQKGQTVLIQGAAGGVGHVAVQLAKLRGARVIGTASKNFEALKSLGVDQAINYTTTKFEDVVHNVDVVLDTVGGEILERSFKTLKPGGILVSAAQQPSEDSAKAYGVRATMVFSSPPIGPTLVEVAKMADAGQLKPIVSIVLPLQEAQKGHQIVEGRHARGKVVLQVAQ